MILAPAFVHHWLPYQMDDENAFLRGDPKETIGDPKETIYT